MTHHLKTWPEYFTKVKSGEKTFELRRNDRNFQVGDALMLEEYEPFNNRYSGLSLRVEVIYIFEDDGTFGLDKDYCIMSIKFSDFIG